MEIEYTAGASKDANEIFECQASRFLVVVPSLGSQAAGRQKLMRGRTTGSRSGIRIGATGVLQAGGTGGKGNARQSREVTARSGTETETAGIPTGLCAIPAPPSRDVTEMAGTDPVSGSETATGPAETGMAAAAPRTPSSSGGLPPWG